MSQVIANLTSAAKTLEKSRATGTHTCVTKDAIIINGLDGKPQSVSFGGSKGSLRVGPAVAGNVARQIFLSLLIARVSPYSDESEEKRIKIAAKTANVSRESQPSDILKVTSSDVENLRILFLSECGSKMTAAEATEKLTHVLGGGCNLTSETLVLILAYCFRLQVLLVETSNSAWYSARVFNHLYCEKGTVALLKMTDGTYRILV